MTLQNGLVVVSNNGNFAGGGAIESSGSLVLSGVTVQGNVVQGECQWFEYGANGSKASPAGQPGSDAFGGGIHSAGGSLTLENGTVIQNNKVIGGDSGNGYYTAPR